MINKLVCYMFGHSYVKYITFENGQFKFSCVRCNAETVIKT